MFEALKRIIQPEEPNKIEDLIGRIISLNPQRLLNRKQLYTTQNYIHLPKLGHALSDLPDFEAEMPEGWVGLEKGHIFYVIGNGNHRIALACTRGQQVPFFVKDEWDGRPKYGFNKIVSKVRSELGV